MAAGPATKADVAEVAINASIAASSVALALNQIRVLLLDQDGIDKREIGELLTRSVNDIDECATLLESSFDDLTAWQPDDEEGVGAIGEG